MKIISWGKPQNVAMTGTCQCECKIECAINETKKATDSDQRPGWIGYYVECPNCHRNLYVEEK